MNVKEVPTTELANELLNRTDINDSRGGLITPLFRLVEKVMPIMCTDGIALRWNEEDGYQVLAIVRGTGRYRGKFCSLGGRILRNESVEQALRRHWKTGLGAEIKFLRPWYEPIRIGQWVPVAEGEEPPPDFGPESTKHALCAYHAITLDGVIGQFGQNHAGQEVMGVRWFSLDTLPEDENAFGYGQRQFFKICLEAAPSLLG